MYKVEKVEIHNEFVESWIRTLGRDGSVQLNQEYYPNLNGSNLMERDMDIVQLEDSSSDPIESIFNPVITSVSSINVVQPQLPQPIQIQPVNIPAITKPKKSYKRRKSKGVYLNSEELRKRNYLKKSGEKKKELKEKEKTKEDGRKFNGWWKKKDPIRQGQGEGQGSSSEMPVLSPCGIIRPSSPSINYVPLTPESSLASPSPSHSFPEHQNQQIPKVSKKIESSSNAGSESRRKSGIEFVASLLTECPICHGGKMKGPKEGPSHISTICGHLFHTVCWDNWARNPTSACGDTQRMDNSTNTTAYYGHREAPKTICPKCRTANSEDEIRKMYLDVKHNTVVYASTIAEKDKQISTLKIENSKLREINEDAIREDATCFNCESTHHKTRACPSPCFIRPSPFRKGIPVGKCSEVGKKPTYHAKYTCHGNKNAGEVVSFYEHEFKSGRDLTSREQVQACFAFYYFDNCCPKCLDPFHKPNECIQKGGGPDAKTKRFLEKLEGFHHPRPASEKIKDFFNKK